ncbi:hypothetical protein B0T21DRAFT_365970 [Apiosordaria backusii]|uniref:NACHT domain-containing protein n=1 Tax=Apiosordaria backusii TaxID=314023 RepID=A0AA40BKK9_9PEZI|nr:hypothetical protein B0T21DRAFT_365970 [Apiosordaria backusii]
MEPIAALAVAGNVLQFVEFAGKLFSNTREVFLSARGTSAESAHLEDICQKLLDFTARLRSSKFSLHSTHKTDPIVKCAEACEQDCEALLAITTKLRAKAQLKSKTSQCWASFKIAILEVWKASEVEAIRSRISDHRSEITLHLCATSSTAIQIIHSDLRQWENFNCRRHQDLLDILQPLEQLAKDIDEACLYKPSSSRVDDFKKLQLGLTALSLNTHQYVDESKVLESLHYRELPLRHDVIAEAHTVTLNWALNTSQDAGAEALGSISRWLSGPDGLFWVSGKPGSGKSTFMKYVADNFQTKTLLARWSPRHEVILAAHYFTVYGTPIQRSLEGLLRSLIYSILRQEPSLIQKVAPRRYQNPGEQEPWKQSELESILRQLSEEQLHVRLCFFIDGLDEYAGDHLEICETLHKLSHSPFVKLCVSSRPWNVFEDALGNKPSSKLYIQDLTRSDIQRYTAAVLRAHPRWNILVSEAGAEKADSLIQEIVEKSSGVFLWVTIVTRLLREGLTNDDSVRDLRRRLESFPSDLEPFFRLILTTVDPFYQDRMARSLLFALNAKEPLHIHMYMFHDQEYDDENYALKAPKATMMAASDGDWKRTVQATRVFRRINGWCKGLLERNHDRIEFLHRTVFDFLQTPAMQTFLEEKARQNNNKFSAMLSLLRASVAYTKHSSLTAKTVSLGQITPFTKLTPLVDNTKKILVYAKWLEGDEGSCVSSVACLLDNLDLSFERLPINTYYEGNTTVITRAVYRSIILETGLQKYLTQKLPSESYFDRAFFSQSQIKSPLLSIFNGSPTIDYARWATRAVVHSGFDTNGLMYGSNSSAWQELFAASTSAISSEKGNMRLGNLQPFSRALETDAYLIFLENGADPNVLSNICVKREQWQIPIWLKFLLYAVQLPHLADCTHSYEVTLDRMLNGAKPQLFFQKPQSIEDSDSCKPLLSPPLLFEDSKNGLLLLETLAKALLKIPQDNRERFSVLGVWLTKALPSSLQREVSKLFCLPFVTDSTGVQDELQYGEGTSKVSKRGSEAAGLTNHNSRVCRRKVDVAGSTDGYPSEVLIGVHHNKPISTGVNLPPNYVF